MFDSFWFRPIGGTLKHLCVGYERGGYRLLVNITACGKRYHEKCEAAQQKMHPTLGESSASDSESKPAPKQVI